MSLFAGIIGVQHGTSKTGRHAGSYPCGYLCGGFARKSTGYWTHASFHSMSLSPGTTVRRDIRSLNMDTPTSRPASACTCICTCTWAANTRCGWLCGDFRIGTCSGNPASIQSAACIWKLIGNLLIRRNPPRREYCKLKNRGITAAFNGDLCGSYCDIPNETETICLGNSPILFAGTQV